MFAWPVSWALATTPSAAENVLRHAEHKHETFRQRQQLKKYFESTDFLGTKLCGLHWVLDALPGRGVTE